MANPHSPDASSPPSVHFVTALAAAAIDTHTVAALVENCDKGECARIVEVGSAAGSWRGTIVDRFAWGLGGGIVGLVSLEPSRLFVYGDSGIFLSTDGGRSWRKTAPLRHVAYATVAGQGLWIVCARCGKVGAQREDTVVAVDRDGVPGATLLTAAGITQVLAVGGRGYVLTSDTLAGQSLRISGDGGSSWRTGSLPGTAWFGRAELRLASAGGLGLTFVSAAEPAAGLQQKTIYGSDDGGLGWLRVAAGESYGYATSVVRPGQGLMWRYGGRAPVYRSTDGGTGWTSELADRIGDAAGRQVNGFAASGDSAWVFARTLSGTGVDAYQTLDGGDHWTELRVPVG
jgi:hypothetical protein